MLLVIDIARLRDVNGLHGFGFGDDLLRQFARRLTAVTARRRRRRGWAATASRCSCRTRPGAEAAGAMAVAVTDALARPFLIAGCEVSRARACRCGACSPTTPTASTG